MLLSFSLAELQAYDVGRINAQPGIAAMMRGTACYSGIASPEPPISLGKSFSFGKPSLTRRTASW